MNENQQSVGRPRVDDMFKRVKISITLPAQVLLQVKERRKSTGESASEFISEALRQQLKRDEEAATQCCHQNQKTS